MAFFSFCLALAMSLSYSQYTQDVNFNALNTFLEASIADGNLAGAITLVSIDSEIVHLKSSGYADIQGRIPMNEEMLVPLGSMTKIITSIAILQLSEQGKLSIDDPVEKYIPEFKKLKVVTDSIAQVFKPISIKPTIRDLLRHTSGMVYGGEDTYTDVQYKRAGFRSWQGTLSNFVKKVAEIPLAFQPNEDWDYSYSHDVLGYIIEQVSQMSLGDYFNSQIFEPLGLEHIAFHIPDTKTDMLSNLYRYEDGRLKLEDARSSSIYRTLPNALSAGGGWSTSYGGLLSSIKEFYIISKVLLDFGQFNKNELLRSASVIEMISNQIGDFDAYGNKYGLGVGVIQGASGTNLDNTIFWAGAPYNTYFWIDYSKKVIAILFTNTAPFGHLEIRKKFKELVTEELESN